MKDILKQLGIQTENTGTSTGVNWIESKEKKITSWSPADNANIADVFYTSDKEKELAQQAVRKYTPSFENPIVTELAPLKAFYRAEEYHQDYTVNNPFNPYVKNVSMPRFQKFKRSCKLKMKR